jgi:hypothetical protein
MSTTYKFAPYRTMGLRLQKPVAPSEDRSLSEMARARFARERRGTGERGSYVPGRTLRELRGIGRMHRFSSSRCGGRQIALPSDLVLATFLEEHWDRQTCELREYFPLLDVEETARIARRTGLQHPSFDDGSPRILCTDLLVCRRVSDSYVWTAIQVVSARHRDQEVSPAYRIRNEYWRRAGVDSRISYSSGLNSPRARNLWLLFGYGEQLVAYRLNARERVAQEAVIRRLRRHTDMRIKDACDAAARESGLTSGECVRAVLQLIASRKVECCLDAAVLLNQPTRSLRF